MIPLSRYRPIATTGGSFLIRRVPGPTAGASDPPGAPSESWGRRPLSPGKPLARPPKNRFRPSANSGTWSVKGVRYFFEVVEIETLERLQRALATVHDLEKVLGLVGAAIQHKVVPGGCLLNALIRRPDYPPSVSSIRREREEETCFHTKPSPSDSLSRGPVSRPTLGRGA